MHLDSGSEQPLERIDLALSFTGGTQYRDTWRETEHVDEGELVNIRVRAGAEGSGFMRCNLQAGIAPGCVGYRSSLRFSDQFM